jgi:hypothetical protein
MLKAAYRFRLIEKHVCRGSKHMCRRFRDMRVSLECGLIRRELPRAVIIRLWSRHVNGSRELD